MAIAGEIICGLAYGSQPLLYAVISEILPRRYRPAAQGGLNASLGAGGIVALLGGSAMVKDYHEGFRAFWYMVTALLAVAAAICAVLYNPPPRPLQKSLTMSQKLQRLDWLGYAMLANGVVLFVVALSWADNPRPWRSAYVLAPLLLGLAFLVGLITQQVIKKDGLFHHELFRGDRNFAIALFIMFVDGMAFFAVNNYFAFEVSVVFETDPVRVGLRFCILFFASVVSSLMIAVYSSWSKNVHFPVVVSFALFVVFFGMYNPSNSSQS
jgi:Fungal trichothecene efflux pump (TRI12)